MGEACALLITTTVATLLCRLIVVALVGSTIELVCHFCIVWQSDRGWRRWLVLRLPLIDLVDHLCREILPDILGFKNLVFVLTCLLLLLLEDLVVNVIVTVSGSPIETALVGHATLVWLSLSAIFVVVPSAVLTNCLKVLNRLPKNILESSASIAETG